MQIQGSLHQPRAPTSWLYKFKNKLQAGRMSCAHPRLLLQYWNFLNQVYMQIQGSLRQRKAPTSWLSKF